MTPHATDRPHTSARLTVVPSTTARGGSGQVRRRVVTGTGATLVLAVASVTAAGAAHADEQYVVRSGDTVSHIAARTGVSVAAIARANRLASASRIHIGQQLVIPTGAPAAAAAPAAAVAAVTHTVTSGETVSAIASRAGTTVAAIVAANKLDARAFIRVGQQLTLPGTAAAVVANVAPNVTVASIVATHTVTSGENVTGIAKKYNVTVAAIVTANKLNARAFIRIGQQLSIPGAPVQLVGNTFAGRTYPEAVVASANLNKATLLSIGVPTKAQMKAKVIATAKAMGVDPALAQAVAFQESGFNQTSVSPANAIGVMQVVPSTGDWASAIVGRHLNLLDPDDNVTAGVAILGRLVANSADLPSAIAGYYQGATSVRKNGMFADTRVYVANIQTHMSRFR